MQLEALACLGALAKLALGVVCHCTKACPQNWLRFFFVRQPQKNHAMPYSSETLDHRQVGDPAFSTPDNRLFGPNWRLEETQTNSNVATLPKSYPPNNSEPLRSLSDPRQAFSCWGNRVTLDKTKHFDHKPLARWKLRASPPSSNLLHKSPAAVACATFFSPSKTLSLCFKLHII